MWTNLQINCIDLVWKSNDQPEQMLRINLYRHGVSKSTDKYVFTCWINLSKLDVNNSIDKS
jgi:hypothetical protein